MFFWVQDGMGLAIAIVAAGLLYILPGAGLASWLARALPALREPPRQIAMMLIAPIAILPALDYLLLRGFGLYPLLALHLIAAGLSLPALKPLLRLRPPRVVTGAAVLWLLSVALFYVDFDLNGRLYQSLLTLDLVKHASVAEALYQHGIPLIDPFVARSQPAGYYYFFYIWAAEVRGLAAPLVDARMAFAGTLFWVGLAFPALLREVGLRAGLIVPGRERRFLFWAILLCFVSGLDFPAMLLRSTWNGIIENQVDWWSEEIGFAFTSILWVPHHISAVIALFFCLTILYRPADETGENATTAPSLRTTTPILVPAAALALASAFGMSIWVTLAAVPLFAIACILACWRRAWHFPALLVGAALLALIIDSLHIRDLLHGRDDGGFPIGLWIRGIDRASYTMDIGPAAIALRIVGLPLGYMLDFGLFAIGSYLYWKERKGAIRWTQMDGLLILSALVGLFITSFVRSTILNNDLGWRAAWLAQLPAMVWTAAVLHMYDRVRSVSPVLLALLLCGMLVNIWDAVGARVIRFRPGQPYGYINKARLQDYQERKAYTWLNRTVGSGAIVQHNPALHRRRFNFGLYGHMRPLVADAEANLFGAAPDDISRRMQALKPIFDGDLTPPQTGATARRLGIEYLLFTSRDPVWSDAAKGPPGLRCVYRDTDLCVVKTGSEQR